MWARVTDRGIEEMPEPDLLAEPLLDAREAAKLLHVPRSTLYELVRAGGAASEGRAARAQGHPTSRDGVSATASVVNGKGRLARLDPVPTPPSGRWPARGGTGRSPSRPEGAVQGRAA